MTHSCYVVSMLSTAECFSWQSDIGHASAVSDILVVHMSLASSGEVKVRQWCAVQAYPKELMQCMLDVSSQTDDCPFYQRMVGLVKAVVSPCVAPPPMREPCA